MVFPACLAILPPIAARAIEYPLPTDQVDQAFSLGRTTDHEELADFLAAYKHDFQYPGSTPMAYVKSIELETPYEQVVLKSMHVPEYDRSKAEEDYQAAGGTVLVRAVVALQVGYDGAIPLDDNFEVAVSQGSRIEPQETNTTVLCNPLNPFAKYPEEPCTVYTREYLLRFSQDQFGRGKVTVKVKMPGGKSLETKFDLDKLK
jgi:hypothetical protein